MKRAILLLSLLALFASAAFAQKPKPSASACPADVTNLKVTFADLAGDLYRSDGGGSYATVKAKGENIDVKFQRSNCTYDFTMNLNFSKRTTKLALGSNTVDAEFFNFDRVASVPVTDGGAAFSDWCSKGIIYDSATGKPVNYPDGTAQDNYAGCRQETDAYGAPVSDANGNFVYYVLRSVGIQAGSDNYGFRYQYSPLDGGPTWAAGTDYIRVYHPTATEWVLTPDTGTGTCVGGQCGRHYDKSNNTMLGDYSVPFRITVNRLN
jgi:hypothetical protein